MKMIKTNDRIRFLKERFEDESVPLEEKVNIIEFFKEYNEIFYGDIDIDSFFRELMDLTSNFDRALGKRQKKNWVRI